MIDRITDPGREDYSIAAKFGELLAAKLQSDPSFYFFSPDETTSNRLGAVFDAEARAWDLPTQPWDLPENPRGRIVELLSENTLFATMLGHVKSGEPAVMASYESFFNIIWSQIVQELKFLEQAESVAWRQSLPAINLLSTSVCWRQDHNGFSHQSPALISNLLSLPGKKANCLFPPKRFGIFSRIHTMCSISSLLTRTPTRAGLIRITPPFSWQTGAPVCLALLRMSLPWIRRQR